MKIIYNLIGLFFSIWCVSISVDLIEKYEHDAITPYTIIAKSEQSGKVPGFLFALRDDEGNKSTRRVFFHSYVEFKVGDRIEMHSGDYSRENLAWLLLGLSFIAIIVCAICLIESFYHGESK